MKYTYIFIIVFSSMLLNTMHMYAYERIASFTSDITIARNGSIHVIETIRLNAEHKKIKRGIYRTFPTVYKKNAFFMAHMPFTVISVTRNGNPEPWVLVKQANGYRIDIGPDVEYLPLGEHTYTITYETKRQLGFFEYHDELYWNVNGAGWDFPIEQLTAIVHLPQSVAQRDIHVEAYTGAQGQKDTNYRVNVIGNSGQIEFYNTKPLRPKENLTIVVGFPKGIILEPVWYQQAWYFMSDNAILLLGLLCALLLLFWYIYLYNYYARLQKPGVVMPLFYPPDHMTPGHVGYIDQKKFTYRQFTADLVAAAVNGFITIEMKQATWLSRAAYIITQRENMPASALDSFPDLFKFLASHKSFIIGDAYNSEFTQFVNTYRTTLSEHFEKKYFIDRLSIIALPIVMSVAIGGLMLLLATHIAPLIIGLFILMYIIFYNILRLYTPEGRKLQNQIEGFKLFLTATEKDRIARVGTPPTKTPELYEHYLPYAIALGVEDQWESQFAPLFAQMVSEGHPYQPLWYIGSGRNHFASHAFASQLNSSLQSSITSSTQVPGSKSGFSSGSGGGGYSGGGGGGGGGGGR
jgi:uncharacterized membrane protein YgcG